MEALNRLPFRSRNAVFERLEKIMDIAALSKAEREAYDATIDAYRDHLAVLDYAKRQGIEIGEKRGLEIGEKRGLEIGEKRGLEIGEEKKARKIALSMKQKGFSIAQIIELTGLDADTINGLS